MIKEFSFRFEDLVIDRKQIDAVLGFTDGLPEPFDTYLQEAWLFSASLSDIRATFILMEDVFLDKSMPSLTVGNHKFNIGRMIWNEIRNSERVAFFICTAGKTISIKSKTLMQGENPILGYVYDVMGSFIAEAAGDKMQQLLAKEVAGNGAKITNRYSPGYCQWHVEDQHKLFTLFNDKTSGVSLTPSALMNPIKSISGVIGIGADVQFRDYLCELCSNKNCIYRSIRHSN